MSDMTCDGGTCCEGCAHHEAAWAARLAAAEANYARECASHDKTCELMNDALTETVQTVAALEKAVDRALAAEAEVERLRAALREIAVGLIPEDQRDFRADAALVCVSRLAGIARAALAEVRP